MSGSSGHCVVVWEWQETQEGWWVPHPPAVTRALERAYAKKLTRVVLADADPAFKGYCVNLRTLTQTYDVSDGSSIDFKVRRSCYVGCPQGARWEWAPICQQRRGELIYEPVPMEAQLVLEEALAGGAAAARWGRWSLCARRLHAAAGRRLRVLRRVHQPPYPITRLPAADCKPRIPQQHTGSSVHSIQSVQSVQSIHSVQSSTSVQSSRSLPAPASCHHGARSPSPRERKPGLARQILHNLNIFSNKSADAEPLPDEQRTTDSECSRGRRHSVDTVSTYLSHESKETEQVCSGSLLDCSAGSDDVFEPPAPPRADHEDAIIAGAWASLARLPRGGAPTPASPRPLRRHVVHLHCLDRRLAALLPTQEPLYVECMVCGEIYGPQSPASARRQPADTPHRQMRQLEMHHQEMRELEMHRLELMQLEMQHREQRQMELHEMRKTEMHQQEQRKKEQEARSAELHQQEMRNLEKMQSDLRLTSGGGAGDRGQCYSEPGEGAAGGAAGGAGAPGGGGEQPRGSMAWSVQAKPLPGYPPHTNSILVTYTFQSGVQGARHPRPGAPYYAVGFPRHSLLPDTPLGRQVLGALREAWARGRLFTVGASQTTGREHVVAWRGAAPPAAAHHYAAPDPDRALRGLLRGLLRDLAAPPD